MSDVKQTLGQAQTLPYVPSLWGYTGLLFFPSGSLHSHCPADSPTPHLPPNLDSGSLHRPPALSPSRRAEVSGLQQAGAGPGNPEEVSIAD